MGKICLLLFVIIVFISASISAQEVNPQTNPKISEEIGIELPQDTLSVVSQDTLSVVPKDTLSVVPKDTLSVVPGDVLSVMPQDTLPHRIAEIALTDSISVPEDSLSVNLPERTGRKRNPARRRPIPNRLHQYYYYEKPSSLYDEIAPSLLYHTYFARLDSLYEDPYVSELVLSTPPDPDYYRLFIPPVYYNSPIKQALELTWEFQMPETLPSLTSRYLPFDSEPFTKTKRLNKEVNRVLVNLYVSYKGRVTTTEDMIMSRPVYYKEVDAAPKSSVLELFRPDIPTKDVSTTDMVIQKPNFWRKGGNGSLQMSQNYISENWYKGGESNNTLQSNLQLYANYNDKEKVQFENMLEIKFGFNTVSSKLDTMRVYRVNTDVVRLTSKLGLQAAKSWYYTVTSEFNTQFFRNYKSNTNDLISAILSPANLTFSIGMDYKVKKKKLDFSLLILPFSYNLRYVGNDKVDETKFGLKKGKHSLSDYGSKVQNTFTYTILPTVVWNSRLYYFTNYEKVEAEWENTFNFVLNRYLSTKLFVLCRFDDGVARVKDHGYLQVQELLSFGINYKW